MPIIRTNAVFIDFGIVMVTERLLRVAPAVVVLPQRAHAANRFVPKGSIGLGNGVVIRLVWKRCCLSVTLAGAVHGYRGTAISYRLSVGTASIRYDA